jgi:hypothetical protein
MKVKYKRSCDEEDVILNDEGLNIYISLNMRNPIIPIKRYPVNAPNTTFKVITLELNICPNNSINKDVK